MASFGHIFFDDVHAEDVALRFLICLDETIDFISQFPDLGNPWDSSLPRQRGLRFLLVTAFENYVVFYRSDGSQIHLLRVLHGRQNIEDALG